jgi:hypothetical protein
MEIPQLGNEKRKFEEIAWGDFIEGCVMEVLTMRTGQLMFRALLIVSLAFAGMCIGNHVYSQSDHKCLWI